MHRTEGANNIEVGGKKLFTEAAPGTTIESNWLNTFERALVFDFPINFPPF